MSKYSNIKTNSYASRKEAKRAGELKVLQACGKIYDLQEQVKYELIPKQEGERACSYIADFRYVDAETSQTIVEDVKGFRTQVYRLKRKLLQYMHGIKVVEV